MNKFERSVGTFDYLLNFKFSILKTEWRKEKPNMEKHMETYGFWKKKCMS